MFINSLGTLPKGFVDYSKTRYSKVSPSIRFSATKNTPDQKLHSACRRGKLDEVKNAIADGANINRRNPNNKQGWTPLITACVAEDVTIVEFLLEQNALNIDQGDNNNRSALSHIITRSTKESDDIVDLLLKKGANANAKDKRGMSSASYALGSSMGSGIKRNKRVDLALNHGGELSPKSLLFYASQNGNLDRVKEALSSGAGVNARDGHSTPVMVAAANGHLPIVKLLVEKRAEIHPQNEASRTPLSRAAVQGHEKVVLFLFICHNPFD